MGGGDLGNDLAAMTDAENSPLASQLAMILSSNIRKGKYTHALHLFTSERAETANAESLTGLV